MKATALLDFNDNELNDKMNIDVVKSNTTDKRIVTKGKEYEVFAVVTTIKSDVFYYIAIDEIINRESGETSRHAWLPLNIFTITDPKMPVEWECHIYEHYPLIVGPAYISGDYELFLQTLECGSAQLEEQIIK